MSDTSTDTDENIDDTDVGEEMRNSFLEYAYSVIYSRALPDARDGLKPVQRRLLYQGSQMGLWPTKGHVKSARLVGDCFQAGALVHTPEGLQPIETIKVGDLVLDPSGEPVEVVERYKNPPAAMVEVTFSTGQTIEVTAGQLFRIVRDDYTVDWCRADQLVGKRVLTLGPGVRTPSSSAVTWTHAELEAYTLGLVVAEGFAVDRSRDADGRTRISMVDKEPLALTALWAHDEGIKTYWSQRQPAEATHKLQHVITFARHDALLDAGTPLSSTKRVPAAVLADKDMWLPFIAAMLDGDGWVRKDRREIVFTTTSPTIVKGLRTMLSGLGVSTHVWTRDVHETSVWNTLFGLVVCGEQATYLSEQLLPFTQISYKRQALQRLSETATPHFIGGADQLPGRALFEELSRSHLGGGWYQDRSGHKFRTSLQGHGSPIRYGKSSQGTALADRHFSLSRAFRDNWVHKLDRVGSPLAANLHSVRGMAFLTVSKVTALPALYPNYDIQVDSDEHAFIVEGLVVHNCMGKLHPHGDAAIYDALVRMAQPFSLRLPMIDGHGNFGSLDDGPAAMRYCLTGNTRVRLADGRTHRIDDLVPRDTPGTTPVHLTLIDENGCPVTASAAFHSGTHPIRTITVAAGLTLSGSHNHPIWCLNRDTGTHEWRTLATLTVGDVAVLAAAPAPTQPATTGTTSATVDTTTVTDELWAADTITKRTWIRSLFNGWSTTTTSRSVTCRAGTKQHANDIIELLLELGILSVRIEHTDTGEHLVAVTDTLSRNRLNAITTDTASPQAEEPGVTYAYTDIVYVTDEPHNANVYSLRVDSTSHAFLAGGFINHNTECRLGTPALTMVDNLDEDVVDFAANYDGRETEPVVLPAGIPNLLVNGASGIAVGMATNMAPHNLTETVNAAIYLLNNPQATLDELLTHMPGPDLPTGGTILGTAGLREAYATGRGTFKMRATAQVEQVTSKRKGIVVTELPYNVGPERVIAKIKELVTNKRIEGISELTDLTDGDSGLRLVIEIKNGHNPANVLAGLYKATPLEESFAINAVALVDGQPQTLGLKKLLSVFINHRRTVITRRSKYRLRKAQARLHLLDGLLITVANIDAIIAIIRGSDDAAGARVELANQYNLSDDQITYILDTPLRRLTKYSVLEIDTEKAELVAAIETLEALLADPALLDATLIGELRAAADTHGTPRRTTITDVDTAAADHTATVAAEEPVVVHYRAGAITARPASTDAPGTTPQAATITTTTSGTLSVITNLGRHHLLAVADIPVTAPGARKPRTEPVTSLVPMEETETPVAVFAHNPDTVIAVGTAAGTVKKGVLDMPRGKTVIDFIRLPEHDHVIGAAPVADGHFVFITSDAQLLRFDHTGVRVSGRGAGGVAGIKLKDGAHAVTFTAASDTDTVITVTSTGHIKATPLADYPSKGRATSGVRCMRLGDTTAITSAWVTAVTEAQDTALASLRGRRDGPGVHADTPQFLT